MPPRSRPLHAVPGAESPLDPIAPGVATVTPPLPAETAPPAPDLLAALDAGDDAAVRDWVRAHLPEPESLLVYALLAGVGILGLVEWPALALSALGQFVIDRRFDGVENVAAELRARVEALTAARATS